MTLFGLNETFFRECWRQRPVLLRGAGRYLLADVPSAQVLAELRERPDVRCDTDGSTVWFYQELDDALPLCQQLVTAGRALFESESVACDLVQTAGPASIGAHFDADDNFSVQLAGAKQWRLSPPRTLPPDLLRRRLLGEPDIGRAELGPDVTRLLVEVGDVLYIPHTWIHQGDSVDDSISVTLSVHTRSFHLDFAASVADALRATPGWELPVPVGPGSRAALERQLDTLVCNTFAAPAAARVRPHLVADSAVAPLAVDMDRVRRFVAHAPGTPTAGFVLPRDGSDTSAVLRALLARRTLRRLLKLIVTRSASTRRAVDRMLYQQCVGTLLGCHDAELERICTEPEVVSLAAIVGPGEPRYEDPVVAELARALVPELAGSGVESAPFALLPDLDGGFTLRRAGVRVVTEHPLNRLVVRVLDGRWQVSADGRWWDSADAPGVAVEPLPRLLDEGPHLSPSPTAWVARHVRDQEVSATDPAGFARFCDAMESGAETLARVWPAGWREVADGVRWLLPLSDHGKAPHNYSVHAFRGLVASSPRRDHRCAQTLVHEAGHNRMSTILDLFELCAAPGRAVWSPVVGASRPTSYVFHGCCAFAHEVTLTERLLEVAPAAERESMARYVDGVRVTARSAVDVLRREAEPTPIGSVVLDEVAEVLDR